jgi:predicted enzyme related to lactoylglutathione lyase
MAPKGSDVTIGKGNLAGKGVYANRDFKKGEVVIKQNLQTLSLAEFEQLPESEKLFTHSVNGQIYLYDEPSRYVNHSLEGNVYNDLEKQADIALRDIKKGEFITGDATQEDIPVLKKVDAVLVKVDDIQKGLDFYRMTMGLHINWKKDDMAALKLGDAELVLTTKFEPETDILVESVDEAVKIFEQAGGKIIVQPEDIPVGRVAVVRDPFGNKLTLVDLSKGLYQTDQNRNVTGVE